MRCLNQNLTFEATKKNLNFEKLILDFSKSDEEEKILEYTRIHGVITKNNAMELLEVSASTASRVIRKMVKNNLLKQNGKARNTHYTIADK